MLDVHPAHHAASTWRDFFIHIATIVIGLLIAVGLEQGVEWFHHHQQAAELRENLHAETEQVLTDTTRCIVALDYRIGWLDKRIDQVKQTVWQHKPLAAPTAYTQLPCATPDIPIWRTAKQSGLAFYLSKGEVTGYSEIEFVSSRALVRSSEATKVRTDLGQFISTFPNLPNGDGDLSLASPEELHQYLVLLTAVRTESRLYLGSLHNMKGTEQAVSGGETHLNAIYAAENKEVHSDSLLQSLQQ